MTVDDLVRRLVAEGVLASPGASRGGSSWSNGPGDRYGEHAHPYDKVLVAVSGSIEFVLPGEQRSALAAGDRLDLPAGTGHGARVGRDGVACLEVHLPRGSVRQLRVHPGWLAAETGRREPA